jgi:hypothetical protein
MSDGTASPCPCGQAQDPQVVSNPPGLPQISYRVDDFTGFRRSLLRPLPGEQAIGIWRPAAGDLGLQVLEWWAYLADILTFYNERHANESYLRTAIRPGSIASLVSLLGYAPAPGIAATGNVAAMRTAAHPDEPLVIPAGMRLSSVATPGVPSQTFEVAAGTSFPGPSAVPVTLLASDATPQLNDDGTPRSVLLAGRVSGIQTGTQLVLAGADFTADDNWSVVTVGPPAPETDPGTGVVNTLVSFSAGYWGPTTTSQSRSQSASYRLMRPTGTAALWSLTSTGTPQPVVPGPPFQVHLSAAVRAISPGDVILFESGDGSPLALATVAGTSEEFAAVPYPGSTQPLPVPWTDSDIGNPPQPGSASYANGTFTINGAGNDIWVGPPQFDQFNYVWQALAGDGSIVARVTSQSPTDPWSKSGVMIKQSTAANSPYALLAVTPGNGIAFQYGFNTTLSGGSYNFPSAWLKLTRSGSVFTAYSSPDGTTWTQVPTPTTITMTDPVTVGIFTCAHNPTAICTATFDNVSVAPPGATVPLDIAVAHTVLTLTLAAQDAAALSKVTDTSTVAVRYGFKNVGTIIGTPAAVLDSLPATVGVPEPYSPPAPSATAFLQDSTGAGVLVDVSAAGPGQATLTGTGTPPSVITTPLAVPLQLLLNVVPVARGTTVTNEVLGSGNAALANQPFQLSKSPLTYFASGAGWASTLQVYVDGVEWQEVTSFYGQAPDARVFVVSRSLDQAVTTVTFGDGVNGARLTSGAGNVVASYRYGSGSASPPAGRLTTITQPQANLASIQNPVAVSGGADPQAAEDVRTGAPASVFSFGRAISALDYQVVAAQAPGVSRVAAHWTFDGTEQRTLVKLYVGDDPAAVAAATAALAGSEDPNRPVSVVAATPIRLELSCTLVVAADRQIPAVVAAATAAVSGSAGGLFSPAQMGIGQRLYRSAVEAALMVPGVVAVHDLTVTRPLLLPVFRPLPPVFRPLVFRPPLFGPPVPEPPLFVPLVLDEVFDPGEGSFFLPPDQVAITGVSASG